MTTEPIVNISEIELMPRPAAYAATGEAAERFDASMGMIAPRIGAKHLGYNITAVPPGKGRPQCALSRRGRSGQPQSPQAGWREALTGASMAEIAALTLFSGGEQDLPFATLRRPSQTIAANRRHGSL